MAQSLEDLLTELTDDAKVLANHGDERAAKLIGAIVKRVRDAAEDYLTWLSEDDATLRSNHARRWFRNQFATWAAEGNAKKERGRYYYRMCIVPQRANVSAAYADGRAAGKAAARKAGG